MAAYPFMMELGDGSAGAWAAVRGGGASVRVVGGEQRSDCTSHM